MFLIPSSEKKLIAKIQLANRPHKDLLTIVERRKLQWYGHVSCSPGLAKTIFQDTANGGKKTKETKEEMGRQHQGMDRPGVAKSQRAVENREKWRKLVAKSSVVPQQPSQLRYR